MAQRSLSFPHCGARAAPPLCVCIAGCASLGVLACDSPPWLSAVSAAGLPGKYEDRGLLKEPPVLGRGRFGAAGRGGWAPGRVVASRNGRQVHQVAVRQHVNKAHESKPSWTGPSRPSQTRQ